MTVSLSLAKQHLEYEDDDRDSLITQYIGAAAAWVENYTGKALLQRAIVETFDRFGGFVELSKGPLVSVTSVAYVDTLEAPQSVTGYRVRGSRIFAPVAGWPLIADYSTVTVTYQAGYATTPADLVSAQLLLIGHYFQSREAVNVATSVTELPLAVESLCRPYRALHV
jgi:uncharacterized phiE125 gp8 family phage protein